jgi:hypothetical protein
MRLTPFEELMHDLHSPDRPMAFLARLHFEGRFEAEPCRRAIVNTLALHSLTRSRVVRGARGLCWEIVGDPVITVQEGDWPAMSYVALNLSEAPAVMVRVTIGESRSALDIQLHHAVSDGRGAMGLLRDFMVEYARATGSDLPGAERDPEMMAKRGSFGLDALTFLKEAPRQSLGLIGIRRALMRNPVRLGPPPDRTDGPPSSARDAEIPKVFFHRFDQDTTTALARAARARGATTNHVLVASIFEAIGAWRESLGERPDGSWIRVAAPFDLRSLEQMQRLPAANVMSLVFLDRRARFVRQSDRLLVSLRNEMGLIRAWRLALTFVLSLAALRPLPGLRRRLMSLRTTAFATNLGRIVPTAPGETVSAGGVKLVEVEAYVPLLPDTPLSFGFYQYAGELNLTLRYDPAVFKDAEARDFFDRYLARVSKAAITKPA